MSAYAAGDKQRPYSTETNENYEMIPHEAHKQTKVNQYSSDTSNKLAQDDVVVHQKTTKKRLILIAVFLAVILFISLAAIILSIFSFIASGNVSSQLFVKLDATNNDITLLASSVEINISQLLIQFDAINSLAMSLQAEVFRLRVHCGAGEWHRIAYLNMSNPSHQCPSAWREYISDEIRMCRRPNATDGSCPGTFYPFGRNYRKVCGRVIGYQYGSPDAFVHAVSGKFTIDQAYINGISITHGTPRTHIWSYAAGASENGSSCTLSNCPCSNGNHAPPNFVGNNYYCESAYRGDCYMNDMLYSEDPLWDGQQCDNEGTCCTGANTPPWFHVDLPDSTHDDIEVRICHNQDTDDEDSLIQLLELYVQ